jgi:hypothetical protein
MESRNKKHSVLIIDYMNFDSLVEIPYLFSRAGFQVDVLCDQNSWLLCNSYFDTHIICNSKQPRIFADQVISLVKNGDYDQVCIVDDVAIRIMNEYVVDDGLALKILPISKLENRKFLGSKAEFSRFCKQYNFLTPDFEIYEHHRMIDFPVLLKIDQSQGGKGVFYCDNESTFNTLVKPGIVIQKYIKGDLIGVEAYFHHGKLIASACSQVQKNLGGEFSISSQRLYSRNIELEDIVRRFGETLGAHGFASISFIYNPTSKKYFIFEWDSRTNAWLRLAELVGVDFSKAIVGQPTIQKNDQVTLRQFPRDFVRSITQRDFKGFLGWIFNTDRQWNMVPWYDIKLVYFIVTRAVRSGIKKICK